MEKALEILKEIRNIETNYDHYLKHRFDEAIAELEEAMKPKTCEECKNLLQKLEHKSPFCVEHNYFLTHESKKVLCCNRYERKDTQC